MLDWRVAKRIAAAAATHGWSGRSAARLAHLHGVQGVVSSNLTAPTRQNKGRQGVAKKAPPFSLLSSRSGYRWGTKSPRYADVVPIGWGSWYPWGPWRRLPLRAGSVGPPSPAAPGAGRRRARLDPSPITSDLRGSNACCYPANRSSRRAHCGALPCRGDRARRILLLAASCMSWFPRVGRRYGCGGLPTGNHSARSNALPAGLSGRSAEAILHRSQHSGGPK